MEAFALPVEEKTSSEFRSRGCVILSLPCGRYPPGYRQSMYRTRHAVVRFLHISLNPSVDRLLAPFRGQGLKCAY